MWKDWHCYMLQLHHNHWKMNPSCRYLLNQKKKIIKVSKGYMKSMGIQRTHEPFVSDSGIDRAPRSLPWVHSERYLEGTPPRLVGSLSGHDRNPWIWSSFISINKYMNDDVLIRRWCYILLIHLRNWISKVLNDNWKIRKVFMCLVRHYTLIIWL